MSATRTRPLVRLAVLAVLGVALLGCDDEGSSQIEPTACEVMFDVQLRLGPRIRSPAPAGLSFDAYAIEAGERIISPSTGACAQVIAGQLQEACAGCNRAPGLCEDLVRGIFEVPAPDCSACGDGLCLTGENDSNCPQDCGVSCGDGTCSPSENDVACPQDCASACGDGVCEPGEDPDSCPFDCQFTVGNGVCEPGETIAIAPEDCQQDTCGDGFCQSFESKLLCPVDCCLPAVCDAQGPLCTGSHAIASCELRGADSCPELRDEASCELGCVPGTFGAPARCRGCQELVDNYVGRSAALDAQPVAGCEVTGATACEIAEVPVFASPNMPIPDGPTWMQHRVIECQPLWGFESCTYGEVVEGCDSDSVCADGACVSCDAVARATGRFDFVGEQYIYGCTPGQDVCATTLTPSGGGGPFTTQVVDCEVLPEQAGCTIGRVEEVCGSGIDCVNGQCGSCLEQAVASGLYNFELTDYVTGCEVGEQVCHTETNADGGTVSQVVDCETLPTNPACTIGRVVAQCGAASAGEPATCQAGSCTNDCEALARQSPSFHFETDDYVFGCEVSVEPQCVRRGLEDVTIARCDPMPQAPAHCTFGTVNRHCGAVSTPAAPALCTADACTTLEQCEQPARDSGLFDLDNESVVFGCEIGTGCFDGDVYAGATDRRVAVADCQALPGLPQCTVGRVAEVCGGTVNGVSCDAGACTVDCVAGAVALGNGLETANFVFGCEPDSQCASGTGTLDTTDHDYVVSCSELGDDYPGCTLGLVSTDCGEVDPGGIARCANGTCATDCDAVAQRRVVETGQAYYAGCPMVGDRVCQRVEVVPGDWRDLVVDCQADVEYPECLLGHAIEGCGMLSGPGDPATCSGGTCTGP